MNKSVGKADMISWEYSVDKWYHKEELIIKTFEILSECHQRYRMRIYPHGSSFKVFYIVTVTKKWKNKNAI